MSKNLIPDWRPAVDPKYMREFITDYLLGRLRLAQTKKNIDHVTRPDFAWTTSDVIEFVNHFMRQRSKLS